MYCPKCGTQNLDEANHCSNCGYLLKPEVIQETQNENQVNPEEDRNEINKSVVPSNQEIINPVYNQGHNSTLNGSEARKNVDSNMVISIVSLVLSVFSCCCINPVSLTLSIIAVVYSSQVSNKSQAGDLEGAQKSSKTALILSLVSIGVMVLVVILWIVLVVVFKETVPYDQFKGQGNNVF